MSLAVQSYHQPEATPVGHSGTRVDIHERPAWAITGWAGVLVVAACIAAVILLAQTSVAAVAVAPGLAAVVIATSLVIVQPGHTKVVPFFGSYVGTLRRTGLWWILPLADRRNPQHPGQELRDQPSEGQRRRRQPGGDRRDCRLAGGRYLAGGLRRR
jgi:hypothetical protein